jgi:NTE family protein
MGAWRVVARTALCAAFIGGCAGSINNQPVNQPLAATATEAISLAPEAESGFEDVVIGLTFSGGGTRAAAFAYGALNEFERTRVQTRKGPVSLADRIDFVSGVSGGSVLAAYFGLKKRAGYADFREKFLLRNAEESLSTDLNLLTISRGLGGGINDTTKFPRWLDRNLYNGATFRDLYAERRPRIFINASDIYNRTPFVFSNPAFSALCSDLASYPVADAVAASAAVPIVFAPVVIQNFPGQCRLQAPEWITRTRRDEDASPLLKSFADALVRYSGGQMRYVKLLDGGLVDNYGLAGITIARLSSRTPFGPMSPQGAVKVRRMLFLIVDAGTAPSGDWVNKLQGPSGMELIMAAADTTTGAVAALSFTAFEETMSDWQNELIAWRCRLSAAERQRLGVRPGWNCRDLKIAVGRLSFDQFPPERAAALNAVETRFKLPPEQVDMLIAAGSEAVKQNRAFRNFLAAMPVAGSRPSSAPSRPRPAVEPPTAPEPEPAPRMQPRPNPGELISSTSGVRPNL